MNTDDASRQRAVASERELKAGVDARAGERRPTSAENGFDMSTQNLHMISNTTV